MVESIGSRRESQTGHDHRKEKTMAKRLRFGTWCRKELKDNKKIVYTFHMIEADGTRSTKYFTSEDDYSLVVLPRLHFAWIKEIKRVKNEFSDHWYAELEEERK